MKLKLLRLPFGIKEIEVRYRLKIESDVSEAVEFGGEYYCSYEKTNVTDKWVVIKGERYVDAEWISITAFVEVIGVWEDQYEVDVEDWWQYGFVE